MTTNNKQTFLRKKLPVYIKMASGLSLMVGALGAGLPALAQDDAGGQVEEILVTGQRASIQSAQDVKKNSSIIVDSLVAEDIGKLPDRSVTEALQRVPGVTVGRYTNNDAEHPAAEGSGVAVRGLTQVRAELNGRDVFSAASGRGLSFEDVPAELMYAVDTYKSPSADMIEGGLGGTVNLRTRMPFDADGQVASVGVKANYGDQIKETNGEYSGLYSNRWETDAGDFGVLVNLSSSDISTRSDQVYSRAYLPRDVDGNDVWVSKGVDWRRNDYQGKRKGGYLALQWAPSEQTEVYFTAFQSKHDSIYDENAFFLGSPTGANQIVPTASDDWVYGANGDMESGHVTVADPSTWGLDFGTSTRWANNTSTTTDYSAGIKWSPDDHWKFSADLQYVKAKATVDDYTLGLLVQPSEAYMDGIGTKTPSIDLDESFMADYSNYSLGQEMTHFERNNADAKTARFDAEYDFDGSIIKSVKAGVRYSEKTADNINTPYDWNTRYATWFGFDNNSIPKVTADQAANYLTLYSFNDFQRGDVQVPAAGYLYSSESVKNFRATTDAVNSNCPSESFSWACDGTVYPDWTMLENPDYRNKQKETSAAMYLMVNYAFEDLSMPIDGNFGVRVVETDSVAYGHLTIEEVVLPDTTVALEGTSEDYNAKTNQTHVLPSFNLRLKATDDLFFRFAASKTVWAPNFSDMQARILVTHSVKEGVTTATSLDDYKFSLSQDSNPFLKPMTANQVDLSAEWYFDDHGGMAYAALFSKKVDNFFRKGNTPFSLPGANGYTVGGTGTWLANVGSADIKGAEIGVNKFFDSLPAPFDGLGIQANYTYIDSKANIPATVIGATPIDTDLSSYGQMPVDQLSKNAFNLVGMYEKDGFSARLAYTWRSKYLVGWGSNGFDPDFTIDHNSEIYGDKARIPVYNDDYGQLDASISYTFMDNYTITAEATNLLKEKTIGIMKQNAAGDHIAYSYAQDVRFAVGLRAKF